MSAPFKVQAQAKAKGEKLKASGKGHEGKKRPRKAAPAGKTKGGASLQPEGEKIEHEPEAVGEDDHAFFDDEDNAGYANFMLSLDPAGLTTFSKKAKDGVAAAPVSKKEKRRAKQKAKQQRSSSGSEPLEEGGEHAAAAAAAAATVGSTTSQAPGSSTPASAVVSGEDEAAATKTPVTAAKPRKKEAVVDAKRRKASTTGWAVEDSGPERLPIKTRRGLLKPNERMQQQQHPESESTAPGKYSGKGVGGEAAAAAAASTAAGSREQQDDSTAHSGDDDNGDGDGDMMSDSEGSVYDSGDDSELEDYSMGEFDDGGADGVGGPSMANGGSGGGSGGGSRFSKVDLAVLRQRRYEQKKALMGELCESILGAPEESLVRPKTVAKGEDERSRMEQLAALVSFHLLLLMMMMMMLDGHSLVTTAFQA